MTAKADAMTEATAAAQQAGVFGWAVFGFFIPLVAVPVVHLRSPKVPALVLMNRDGGDRETALIFEAQFVQTLKARQVSHAWVGALLGFGLTFLMLVAAA